jgi:hypothetical protein
MRPVGTRVRTRRDDERDPLVEIPQRGREPPLSQASDSRHEGVMKRGEDPARGGTVLADAPQLFVLLRDPAIHEPAKQALHVLLRRAADHRERATSGDRSIRPRRTHQLAARSVD